MFTLVFFNTLTPQVWNNENEWQTKSTNFCILFSSKNVQIYGSKSICDRDVRLHAIKKNCSKSKKTSTYNYPFLLRSKQTKR